MSKKKKGSDGGMYDDEMVYCSFCGRLKHETENLIAGPGGVMICDECIELCHKIVLKEMNEKNVELEELELKELPTPKEIKSVLDEYVIGQDMAKKVLAVSVYNHYKRINNKKIDEIEVQKSNVLLLGPSGSGKTLLAQTLAKMLHVPFAIADATTLTEAGYVGDDVENILLRLIQSADYDINKAQKGIIYIDELDKIARKSENTSITRDVSGEGVQQALLKIIEGTESSVPAQGGRKHPQQSNIKINTKDILFICGGAFEGLEKIVGKRVENTSMGFGAKISSKDEIDYGKIYSNVEANDIVKFGLIPELIGRLPVTTYTTALDKEALINILTKPKNAIIKQYKKLLKMDKVNLSFEKEALEKIVDKALERKTGARGLRSIIESVMLETMFEVPSNKDIKKCIITKDTVLNKKSPKFEYRD